MADLPPYPGTPRWVKVLGILLIALVVMVVFMLFGGGHGPGRHIPSGDDGSRTPPIAHEVQQP